MGDLPDRVSAPEFARRHQQLRTSMKKHGLDAVLVFGTFQGWQNVFYLSNHWDLVSCYLIFPAASDPVLVTGVYPHLPAIREVSIIKDVRFGGTRSVEQIAAILEQRGIATGSIGLIEPDSYRMPGIPHGDMARLRAALPRAKITSSTAMLEDVRRLKSDEEITILRECARLSDDALQRVAEAVRPGISELELAHVIEAAPGQTTAVLVGSTSMTKPHVPNPSIRPTARELKDGDVVLVELSKGGAGYAGQVHGMISVGTATDRYLQAHRLALDAYRAVVAVLRAGTTAHQIAAAASMIEKAGFVGGNPLTHGFGMGIESGLHVGLPGPGPYWPPGEVTFPAGATVTIEPNPCNADMTFGSTAGGLVLVTQTGCEELQRHAGSELIQKSQ